MSWEHILSSTGLEKEEEEESANEENQAGSRGMRSGTRCHCLLIEQKVLNLWVTAPLGVTYQIIIL